MTRSPMPQISLFTAPATPLTPLTARLSLWFMLLAFAVGAAPLALDTHELTHPKLLIAALGGVVAIVIVVRIAKALRSKVRLRCFIETFALLAFAFLIALATGGVNSSFLSLFLLPLTLAAISLTLSAYAAAAALMVVAYIVLGALTPQIDIASAVFVVHLIGLIAPVLVATAAIAVLIGRIQAAEQQISELSTADPLTGLYTAPSFEQRLIGEHRKSERLRRPFSLVKVDLDNLGDVSQSIGGDAANKIVLAVSNAIGRSIRSTDVAARLAGHEFAALLVGADTATAVTIGQRIRNNVYAGTISVGNRLVRATVSIGIATFPKDHTVLKELQVLADERLEQDRAQRAARG